MLRKIKRSISLPLFCQQCGCRFKGNLVFHNENDYPSCTCVECGSNRVCGDVARSDIKVGATIIGAANNTIMVVTKIEKTDPNIPKHANNSETVWTADPKTGKSYGSMGIDTLRRAYIRVMDCV